MVSRRSTKRTTSSGDEGSTKDASLRSKTSNRKIKRKVYPDSIYTDDSDKQLVIDEDEPVPMQAESPVPEAGPSQKVNVSPASLGIQGTKGKDPKKKKSRTNKDSSSSSEEERWLEKIKDPKMMTARQRAMYDRENTNSGEKDFVPPEMLMSLPTGYKEKVLTAEAIERAQVKSAKRKQLADEKREKDKRKTMERLLKKQESKLNKVSKSKQLKPGVPIITYKSTAEQSVLIFPSDFDLGLSKASMNEPPKIVPCEICRSPKRYNCSKTNIPLCSFKCYKENMSRVVSCK